MHLTSLSCSQLELPNPRAALWRGIFTYFHNGQIRRVHCSMKHFIPANSSSGLSLRARPTSSSLSVSRISVAGTRRNWGRKQLHLCSDTAVCSELLISVLVRQYDSSVSQFLSNSILCRCSRGRSGTNSLTPHAEDDYLIPLFYTCSLGVCLCKNNHFDLLFIPSTDALSYILITVPYAQTSPVTLVLQLNSDLYKTSDINKTHKIYKCSHNML